MVKRLYLFLLIAAFSLLASAQMEYKKTLKVGEDLRCSINATWVGYMIQSTEISVSGSAIVEEGPRSKLGTSIRAVKPGYGWVSVTVYLKDVRTNDIDMEYAFWDITVIDNKPTSVSVSPSSSSLFVGESVSLSPVFYPSGTQSDVTWSSSDNSVATVSSRGWVDAVGAGTARISVLTENGLTGSATIYVSKQATGISLPQSVSVDYHSYQYLSPTLSPEGAKVKYMSWWSSDESIVTVSSEGLLYGNEPGQTSVTVLTSNGLSATCSVTVKQPPFVVTCESEGTTGVSVINQSNIIADVSPQITKGSQFDNIRFENAGGSKVEGEAILTDSKVSFVPHKPLKPFTTYQFVIPKGALCNQWGSENTEEFRFSFTTGDLEPLDIVCLPNREYIEQGTGVGLLASNPSASIYYTLDGSEPTEKSALFSEPVIITKEVDLRAVAILEGYQQAYLSRHFKVSHVSMVERYPEGADLLYNYNNVIPCVTFNHTLQSKTTGDFLFYKGEQRVPAQAHISGNRIYLIPESPLTEGQYFIIIPDDYAQALNGEPTSMVEWEFSVGGYVSSISAGYNHAIAVKANGELWGWGRLECTSPDIPNATDSLLWQPTVFQLWPVKSASAGLTHNVFIDEDDEIYTWGLQYCGEMGSSTIVPYDYPKYVGMSSQAVIAAGMQTTAVIEENGNLIMMGRNDYGQQGNGNTSPVSVTSNIKSIGVSQVALGYGTTFALCNSGDLFGWGHNNWHQLSPEHTKNLLDVTYLMSDVRYVAASRWDEFVAAVIKNDNSLWMWGKDSSGRLGGQQDLPIDKPVKLMDDVLSVSIGTDVVAAIKTDNSLWMWGTGSSGELANGKQGQELSPQKVVDDVMAVDIGGNFVVALKTDGSVWTWGKGLYGELGLGNDKFFSDVPCQIIPGRSFSELQALQLDVHEVTLSVGDEFLVGGRPVPLNANYQQWQWSVNDPDIATVSDLGVITALREGSTEVVLTSDGGISASYKLYVSSEADKIKSVSDESGQAKEQYYSLDGQKMEKPKRGIVIVRKGNAAEKRVVQ